MAVLIWVVGIFCAMLTDSYYQSDLAWVHHTGYAHHVGTGIVRLLRDAGLGSGARILDAGCGSGLLARTLRIEGFAVLGSTRRRP
jgi:2-polyprenyl-3-methyl-5-hydroxy-6-metoxy-1,4-benzoquinol methylase